MHLRDRYCVWLSIRSELRGSLSRDADMFFCCRICAITIYRVQVTSTIGDPTNLHAQDMYCRIALLTSLEALLGIVSACLPMLRPILQKLRGSLLESGTNPIKPSTSGSIPIIMRKSQMPNSSSRKQYSSECSSTTDSLWYEKHMEGKYENQGSPKPKSDRVTGNVITVKPHSRDADAESLVSSV